MERVWFVAGVSTDAGIHIGSTLDDLRSAYDSALQGQFGRYYVFAPGPPPVATLEFLVNHGAVTAIGFGGRQSIDPAFTDTVWC